MSSFDDILGAEVDLRSEKAIQNDALVDLSELPNSLFFRNNTGQAWQGKRERFYPGTPIPVPAGTVVLTNARPVKFGLEGSGDILGAVEGAAVAVEMKDAVGRQRTAQATFAQCWTRAGGIYVLARSRLEAVVKVRDALRRRSSD